MTCKEKLLQRPSEEIVELVLLDVFDGWGGGEETIARARARVLANCGRAFLKYKVINVVKRKRNTLIRLVRPDNEEEIKWVPLESTKETK